MHQKFIYVSPSVLVYIRPPETAVNTSVLGIGESPQVSPTVESIVPLLVTWEPLGEKNTSMLNDWSAMSTPGCEGLTEQILILNGG